jgi:CTP synthase (UTP-ammonia lyase)
MLQPVHVRGDLETQGFSERVFEGQIPVEVAALMILKSGIYRTQLNSEANREGSYLPRTLKLQPHVTSAEACALLSP